MISIFYKLSNKDLAWVRGRGDFTPYKGFGGGGTYTSASGNTFSANPYQLSIGLNNQASNKLTTTLYTLGSLALTNPGLAAGSSALGSLLSNYNHGKGIVITQPTFLPIPLGMHVRSR